MASPHLLSPSTNLSNLLNASSSFSKRHLFEIHAQLLKSFYPHSIANILFHCNTILKSLSQTTAFYLGFPFFNHMQRHFGLKGNAFSLSFLLKCCVKSRSFTSGAQVHSRIVRHGHFSDNLLTTDLLGFYSACNEAKSARYLFDEMPVKDTVAWNVLISCYCNNKRTRDALSLFDEMLEPKCGSEPSDVTCLLVLQACASLGALEFGDRVLDYADKHNYTSAINIRNSLITMYSKCGSMERAYEVFSKTSNKTVVSWSAMISGLAMNGFEGDAIEAFWAMVKSGISPDEHAFTGVLSACSRGGLVEEGFRFFDMMQLEYRLVPNINHYGCMVYLMGRAGLLDRAYGFIINEMGVEPDVAIWRILLGACRFRGNIELGERVVTHLVEAKAQEVGDYVLLLNLFESAGKWEKAADLRRLLNDKGVQDAPDCTTIKLCGQVYRFTSQTDSLPRKEEIYQKLDEILSQLKIAGYVADLNLEIGDNVGSYHSEKLAVAFGMIMTPPLRTLRVAKNARICADCHDFMKVLSAVYNRAVIVSDPNRFHHFKVGQCSCDDNL